MRFRIRGPRRITVLFRDIVDQYTAEELRESETRLRDFGEAASDALWIADAATGFLEYSSLAFEEIWGEPREPRLPDVSRVADFLHAKDRKVVAPVRLPSSWHERGFPLVRLRMTTHLDY